MLEVHIFTSVSTRKMKTVAIGLCLVCSFAKINAQTQQSPGHFIEGSKLVVELIKALSNKRDIEKNPGCRNMHADVCISNECLFPLVVTLHKRSSGERRELVIQPSQQECS